MSYLQLPVQWESVQTLEHQLEVSLSLSLSLFLSLSLSLSLSLFFSHTHTHHFALSLIIISLSLSSSLSLRCVIQHRGNIDILCSQELLERVLWSCLWSLSLPSGSGVVQERGDNHSSIQDLVQTRFPL